MLEQLKDFVRDREVGLGIIMVVAGTLVMFEFSEVYWTWVNRCMV